MGYGCSSEKDKNIFDNIEKQYHVSIHFKNVQSLLPKQLILPPANAKVIQLSNSDLPHFQDGLLIAFERYPENVISQNVHTIGITKILKFYNLHYGGTYIPSSVEGNKQGNAIYISKGLNDEVPAKSLEVAGAFHHEFSSLLMKNYRFPTEKWLKTNPPNFSYTYKNQDGGLKAIKENGSQVNISGGDDLYKQGFISEYATSSIEEDFNVLSGVCLTYPEWMESLATKHKALQDKLKVWINFYESIDPNFNNIPYFQHLKSVANK